MFKETSTNCCETIVIVRMFPCLHTEVPGRWGLLRLHSCTHEFYNSAYLDTTYLRLRSSVWVPVILFGASSGSHFLHFADSNHYLLMQQVASFL